MAKIPITGMIQDFLNKAGVTDMSQLTDEQLQKIADKINQVRTKNSDTEEVPLILYAEKAARLVIARIEGHRKGMPDMPNYLHSFRVAKLLNKYGFDQKVQLAGLLHDVVEDGGVMFDELAKDYPMEVVDIVRLCTHDMSVPHKDHRWILMIAELAKADSAEALAVKLADVFDNLMDASALSKDREMFMREVKIPTLLTVSKDLLENTPLWKDLNHVALSITQMIGEIGGRVEYVRHEIKTTFDLPEVNEQVLLALCDEVDASNYGVANLNLRTAIGELHDVMERFGTKDWLDDAGLSILANGLCGDMLFHLQKGVDIKGKYRQAQESCGM